MVATVRLLSVAFSGALTRSLSSRDVLLGDSDTTPSSRPRGSSFGVDVELGGYLTRVGPRATTGATDGYRSDGVRLAHHLTTHPGATPQSGRPFACGPPTSSSARRPPPVKEGPERSATRRLQLPTCTNPSSGRHVKRL